MWTSFMGWLHCGQKGVRASVIANRWWWLRVTQQLRSVEWRGSRWAAELDIRPPTL